MAYSKSYTRVHSTGWENEQDSYNTPLSAENLNVMDVGIDTLDDRIVALDNAKVDVSAMSNVFQNVSFDDETGIFTFTKFDGTTKTIDTMLEKVVTNFDFDEETQKLTLTLEDGSIKEVDLSSFISEYEFEDSDTIVWTVVNHKAVASVKNHSIGADQLETDYLTNCQLAESNANTSATSASADALEAEGYAKGTQNGVEVGSDSPYYRDNAKYWSDRAGTKTLDSLDDVQISNPTDKQSLVYNAELGKWVNGNAKGTYKLSAPTDVVATPSNESVTLKWKEPNDIKIEDNYLAKWSRTIVVRKVGSAPTSETDGTVVVTSTVRDAYATDGYVDDGLTNDTEYFYGIFPMTVDDVGNYSTTVSATPQASVNWIYTWSSSIGMNYTSLDDIPETDMRTLMTSHTSSDVLLSLVGTDENVIENIILSATAMKWIGLRDYICDKLMAITDFKTKALASDNWEFILKDHVPIMTSDSAPYGTAYADVTNGSSYSAYNAFSDDNSKVWADSANSTVGHYIYYKFTNPICVKRFMLKQFTNSNVPERLGTVNFEASNTGNSDDWTSIQSGIKVNGRSDNTYNVNVNNDNYYLYYRIVIASKLVSDCILLRTLQFFGRSLNVSESTQPQNKPYQLVNGTYYTVDYSERSDRTYLYDHGVELVPFDAYSASTSNRAEKQCDRLYIDSTGATANLVEIYNTSPINFTGKNLLRAICDDELYRSAGTVFGAIMITNSPSYHVSNAYIAYVDLVDSIIPNHVSLDISEVSGDKYIAFEHRSGSNTVKSTLNEIWIE